MVITLIKKYKLIFITLSLYIITLIFSNNLFFQAFQTTKKYLLEMLIVMPVIFMLTVLIDVWISKEAIIKHLGEKSGLKGAVFSIFLGSLSAGPIYAAFPICKMLLSKGASVANIVIILSAWAVIKLPMLAMETRFLGINFMILRWILTVVAIYIMAFITGKLVKKEEIHKEKELINEEFLIKQNYCVGCSICVKMMPEVFEIEQKKAQIKFYDKQNTDSNLIVKTAEKCPTKAILINKKYISKN